MSTFVDFITDLVYKSGAGAIITPNHRDWIQAGGHTGTQWIAHYVDLSSANSMLSAFEAWRASNFLPPTIEWDGVEDSPYDPTDNVNAGHGVPLTTGLDGSAWRTAASPITAGLRAVWGRANDDVFAVGDGGAIVHFDGAAWSVEEAQSTARLNDVSGEGPDVFAVGAGGVILHREE